MTAGKSKKIKTSFIRFGRRSYFFDVLESGEKKYLKITESKWMGEGKDRVYNSFLLFPNNVKDFQKNLADMANSLGN